MLFFKDLPKAVHTVGDISLILQEEEFWDIKIAPYLIHTIKMVQQGQTIPDTEKQIRYSPTFIELMKGDTLPLIEKLKTIGENQSAAALEEAVARKHCGIGT